MPQLNQQFKFFVPFTGYQIRKSADGTEKYVIQGMASNTNLDLTGERMAESAIASMVKSFETHPVAINNEHSPDWDADFGELTRAWATPEQQLMVEAELNPDHYRTRTLIKALDKGKQLGLSIGGVVKDAALEWVDALQTKVLTYRDIDIFHVAITGTPAVPDTWVAAVAKSVKTYKETPMPEETTKAKLANWTVGAARDLPVKDGTWDGQAAKDSIFAWAGWPDNPDPSKAKQGFLAYDTSSSDEKGAYHLPFARVEDGTLTAITNGVRNAASRLPQTEIPQSVKDDARKVLDTYLEKMHADESEDATDNSKDEASEGEKSLAPATADHVTKSDEPVTEPSPETAAAKTPSEPVVETPEASTPEPETEAEPETPAVEVNNETPAESQAETAEEPPASEPDAPETESTTDQPVESPAAGQEETPATPDEVAAGVSVPDQATEHDTSEVTKSAVFGDDAEAQMTGAALSNLFWDLQAYIFNAMDDTDDPAAERLQAIQLALGEFTSLVSKVTTALITEVPPAATDYSQDDDDYAVMFSTLKAQTPVQLAKRLREQDALTKAVADKTAEIETIQKTLTETQAALTEAQTQLEVSKKRKAYAFAPAGTIATWDSETTNPSATKSVKDAWLDELGIMKGTV